MNFWWSVEMTVWIVLENNPNSELQFLNNAIMAYTSDY